MPIPLGLVEKNGSKMCAIAAGSMPLPESRTAISGLVFIRAHADEDFAELVFFFRNGVEGIKNQIENYLLELDSIANHSHPLSGSLKRQRYVSQQRVAANHAHYFGDYVSKVERYFLDLAFAKEVTQPLDSLSRTQIIQNDIAYRCPDVLEIGLSQTRASFGSLLRSSGSRRSAD